jgi:hypothetical protein
MPALVRLLRVRCHERADQSERRPTKQPLPRAPPAHRFAQGNAGDGLAKVEGIRSRHRISEREIGERASGAGPPGPGARELGGKCYGRTRARSPGTQFGRVGFARKRVDLVQSRRFFVEVKGDLPANVVWFNHLFG